MHATGSSQWPLKSVPSTAISPMDGTNDVTMAETDGISDGPPPDNPGYDVGDLVETNMDLIIASADATTSRADDDQLPRACTTRTRTQDEA